MNHHLAQLAARRGTPWRSRCRRASAPRCSAGVVGRLRARQVLGGVGLGAARAGAGRTSPGGLDRHGRLAASSCASSRSASGCWMAWFWPIGRSEHDALAARRSVARLQCGAGRCPISLGGHQEALGVQAVQDDSGSPCPPRRRGRASGTGRSGRCRSALLNRHRLAAHLRRCGATIERS
jgi:hypothetical protein